MTQSCGLKQRDIENLKIHFQFLKLERKKLSHYGRIFVGVQALRPSQHGQQFSSHVGMFSWVEAVLNNEDEASCSKTQHRVPGEIQDTVSTELTMFPLGGACI